MPIHYKYKEGQKILYIFCEGKINARDCSEHINTLVKDETINSANLVVMDMSQIELLDMDYEEANALSVQITQLHQKGIKKFLLHAPGSNTFGIARMLQTLFEQDGSECHVVKTEKEVSDVISQILPAPVLLSD